MIRETLRSGSIAAVAMMPFGLAFRALGLRINQYGPAVLEVVFGPLPAAPRLALMPLEHFLIAWTVAVPLLLMLRRLRDRRTAVVLGAGYGVAFYMAVNSLALPWLFGDLTPWQLGVATVVPSLSVHLVYGISIALTACGWARPIHSG
ncbi:MAG TPA: hypothetical protein VKB51_17345 [bacterium]|nr:hypothetical protein [bacterium]